MGNGYRKKYIDLHIHSIYSDGTLTVKEIVEYASAKKLSAISLTDHDCVAGVREITEIGAKIGLEVISGVEISSMYESEDVHVLGYMFDPWDRHISEKMDEIRLIRMERARKIVEKLNSNRIAIRFERVLEFAKGFSIGRPHIAAALLAEEYVASYAEAFDKYLGNSTEYFIPVKKLSTREAIALIKNAGGIAILAHPFVFSNRSIPEKLIGEGFDGIEVYYPKQSLDTINYFHTLCDRYKLLVSGGSDCHGSYYDEISMGSAHVPYFVLEKMKNFLGRK